MGYLKIKNLHKDSTMLSLFKEIYVMEKIHGTSTHITYKNGELRFFKGGIGGQFTFEQLFNKEKLLKSFEDLGHDSVIVYGEAYGGSTQKMSKTYGQDLKFIAFEVQIGDYWLSTDKAYNVVQKLDLDFVQFVRCEATEERVNYWRDKESEQAIRNGMGSGHIREGIVIRPIVEVLHSNGGRFIAKHKSAKFSEHKTPMPLDPDRQEKFNDAKDFAEEFVVPMRIRHVIDKIKSENDKFEMDMKFTKDVIVETVADVLAEEGDRITWSLQIEKAIGRQAVLIFKKMVLGFDDE